jgi:hypothetical protein
MKIAAPMFFVDLKQIASHARLAEELGYESIWLGEHIALSENLEVLYPGGRPIFNSDTPMNDPLMVFALSLRGDLEDQVRNRCLFAPHPSPGNRPQAGGHARSTVPGPVHVRRGHRLV